MSLRLYKLIEIKTAPDPICGWSAINELFPSAHQNGDIITIEREDLEAIDVSKLCEGDKEIIEQITKDINEIEDDPAVEYYMY